MVFLIYFSILLICIIIAGILGYGKGYKQCSKDNNILYGKDAQDFLKQISTVKKETKEKIEQGERIYNLLRKNNPNSYF